MPCRQTVTSEIFLSISRHVQSHPSICLELIEIYMEFKILDSERKFIFRPLDEANNWKILLNIYKIYQEISLNIIYLFLEMYMEFQVTSLKWPTMWLFYPCLTQGEKWKFRVLSEHLKDKPNHILECQ